MWILLWTCIVQYYEMRGLPGWLSGKESSCRCRRHQRCWFSSQIPCRRKWQHALVFLPGELYRQRSLAGYSQWGRKELDMTEWLSRHACTMKLLLLLSHFSRVRLFAAPWTAAFQAPPSMGFSSGVPSPSPGYLTSDIGIVKLFLLRLE